MEITQANYKNYSPTKYSIVAMATDNITRLDYIFPTAKKVYLARNPVREITCELPDGLVSLILTNTNIDKLPELPDSLHVLDLRGTNMPDELDNYYEGKEDIARFKMKQKIKNYIKLI